MNIASESGCLSLDGHSVLPLATVLSLPDPTQPLLFVPNIDTAPTPAQPERSDRPLRRPLRVLLMGDRQDVLATIQNLHKRGFADAGEWSVPLPYPQQNPISQFIPRPGYPIVISVHTKYMS